MRTPAPLLFLLAIGLVSLSVTTKPGRADEPAQVVAPAIEVLPVVTLRAQETTPLTLRFSNESRKAFAYFGGTPGAKGAKIPNRLELRLRQAGKELKPNATADSLIEFPHNLQQLAPGDFVDIRWSLPDDYLPLPPGRYEVWAHYEIAAGNANADQIRVTPLSFHKQILWLDVIAAE